MAKWHGVIGYGIPTETKPGVWKDEIVERTYRGDVVRNYNGRWTEKSDSTNDDFNVNSSISIVSDPFANQNFTQMRYIVFMGVKWKIIGAEIKRPRIIVNLGGVYNGK